MPPTCIGKPVKLTERAFSPDLRVDSEAGVIHGVKILGRESKNGRTYTDKALGDAARFYEGVGVNIDHPNRESPHADRGFAEGFGEIRGVSIKADGVYGDLHYLTKHPLAEMAVEKANRMPGQFGLSHNAEGYGTRRGGKLVVEGLESVRSVDIVLNPATNVGLFESEETVMRLTLREIVEKAPKSNRMAQGLREQMEAGALAPEMGVEVEDGASMADEIMTAFETAAIKVIRDRSMTPEERADKVKGLLKKAVEAEEEAGGGEESAEAPAVEESTKGKVDPQLVQLQEKVNRLERDKQRMEAEAEARDLLEQHNVEVKPARVNALINAADESQRRELLEDWPKRNGRPSRSAPLYPREDAGSYPSSTEDFLKSVRV